MTRLGLSMVEFPLPPHLTCAVIRAASLDCEDLLLPIAAMLSVENVFIRPGKHFILFILKALLFIMLFDLFMYVCAHVHKYTHTTVHV